jgi:hypothetical protein
VERAKSLAKDPKRVKERVANLAKHQRRARAVKGLNQVKGLRKAKAEKARSLAKGQR